MELMASYEDGLLLLDCLVDNESCLSASHSHVHTHTHTLTVTHIHTHTDTHTLLYDTTHSSSELLNYIYRSIDHYSSIDHRFYPSISAIYRTRLPTV